MKASMPLMEVNYDDYNPLIDWDLTLIIKEYKL